MKVSNNTPRFVLYMIASLFLATYVFLLYQYLMKNSALSLVAGFTVFLFSIVGFDIMLQNNDRSTCKDKVRI